MSWWPVVNHLRDSVPETAEVFILDDKDPKSMRAQVWRWKDHEKWSWLAIDGDGNHHEDRPDALNARLFDTNTQAKNFALSVAGVPDRLDTSGFFPSEDNQRLREALRQCLNFLSDPKGISMADMAFLVKRIKAVL